MNQIILLIVLIPVTFAFPLKFALSVPSLDYNNHQTIIRKSNQLQIDPENERQLDHRLLQNPDLFEGDILATSQDEGWRFAVPKDDQLWPQGIIPYVIDASLNDIKEHIDAALEHIQNRTCIKFKKRTTEEDYVKYFSGNGCFAAAGRQGNQQTVSIGKGCDYHGIIVHETMHAIGFHHMHTRSDRDNYLDIFWENIAENFKSQFQLQSPQDLRLITPFDYESIMMYGSTTGSKDNKAITMLPVNRTIKLVDTAIKPGLSYYDIEAISQLYKCNNY